MDTDPSVDIVKLYASCISNFAYEMQDFGEVSMINCYHVTFVGTAVILIQVINHLSAKFQANSFKSFLAERVTNIIHTHTSFFKTFGFMILVGFTFQAE